MRIPASHIVPKLPAAGRFDAIGEMLDRLLDAGQSESAFRLKRRRQTPTTETTTVR
jgi:hypothetical protein